MKKPALINLSVLLIFFNRPDKFAQVFAQVKQARPARLFLYQDGSRGEKDNEGIRLCREIAEDIDWECEVFRFYQQENKGCDPSEFIAQRWAFGITDKCLVLEDDDVPSLSFFSFCKEMLDLYENDERIAMISGFNVDERTTDVTEDYFFTSTFSIWGWASWARVVNKWDEHYTFLDHKESANKLQSLVKAHNIRNDFMPMCYRHKASGVAHYESIFWANMLLNNALAIMPTVNMISNIGVTDKSTHFSGSITTLPKGIRKMFTMTRFELNTPLKHPQYVIDHVAYKNRLYAMNAWNNPCIKVRYSLEELWLNLKHGNFSQIKKALGKRIAKWLQK